MEGCMRFRFLFLPVLCVAPAATLHAQAGHGHHGTPAEKLGRVEFATSCNAGAQAHFERGLALLHSFWWPEAEKAFGSAAQADPACAMAYWGTGLVHRGNWFAGAPGPDRVRAGLDAAERAVALNPPTPRERDYAAAVLTLFRDPDRRDHRARSLAYEEAMRGVFERYPDDREAAVFYALAVTANASPADKSFERQKRAGAILEPLFERSPDHPGVAHYLIHTYDAPAIAHLGAGAARRYGEIAPSVPHAQHMPSHIFTRLGLWEESIRANRASALAAQAYEEAERMTSVSFDRAHAWDYLTYAYLQQGQDAEARAMVEEVGRATAAPSIATDYAFAAIPARYALERSRWREAAQLPVRASPGFRAGEAITHFARGIGSARSGDLASARREAEALAAIRAELEGRNDPYWAQIVEAQRLAVSAWIARGQGSGAEALQLVARAAEIEETVDKHPVTPGPILPSRELEGDLLLELNRPAEALRAYEVALRHEPNRARTLYGAARAAELAGNASEARRRYAEYLQLIRSPGSERPEVRRARTFVGQRE
jgi:tetratricopeptide (TPR) repeat protein